MNSTAYEDELVPIECAIRGCVRIAWRICPDCDREICYAHSTLNRGEIRCRTCIANHSPATNDTDEENTTVPAPPESDQGGV